MIGFAMKVGVRAAAPLRRPTPQSLRQQHHNAITKRRQTTNSSPRSGPTTTQGTSIPIPATIPTLPLWQRLGPLTRGAEAYGRAQRKRPWTTQFISSLIVYFCGDISAQSLRDDEYEPSRTAKALVIGAGSAIPAYSWFMYLGNSFNYASPLLSLITKVVVNQLVFTPIFNSYFFGMQALLSGHHSIFTWDGFMGIVDHVKRTVPTSFINSCKFWPVVTAFSFTFISPEFRSIFAGVFAIGWQTYLSFLNRKAEGEQEQEKEREEHEHPDAVQKVGQRAQMQARGRQLEESVNRL